MTTLAELRAEVETLAVNVPDGSNVDPFIRSAQKELETRHSFQYMEAVENFVATPGDQRLAINQFNLYRGPFSQPLAGWVESFVGKATYRVYSSIYAEEGGGVAHIDNEYFLKRLRKPVLVSEADNISHIELDWIQDGQQAGLLYGRGQASGETTGAPRYVQEAQDHFRVWPVPRENANFNAGQWAILIAMSVRELTLTDDGDSNRHLDRNDLARNYIKYQAAGLFLESIDDMRADQMFERAETYFRRAKRADKLARRQSRSNALYPNKDARAIGPQIRRRA